MREKKGKSGKSRFRIRLFLVARFFLSFSFSTSLCFFFLFGSAVRTIRPNNLINWHTWLRARHCTILLVILRDGPDFLSNNVLPRGSRSFGSIFGVRSFKFSFFAAGPRRSTRADDCLRGGPESYDHALGREPLWLPLNDHFNPASSC